MSEFKIEVDPDLLNQSSGDLSEYMQEPPEPVYAYCSSFRCTGDHSPSKLKWVIVPAKRNANECPVCNHMLFWSKLITKRSTR